MTIEELFVEEYKKLDKKIDELHKDYEELAQHCAELENRIAKYKEFVKLIDNILDFDVENSVWVHCAAYLKTSEIKLFEEVGINIKKEENKEDE